MVRASPHLIVLSGLPGTGKTTLARSLAARLGAVYLRIDSIEQAMRQAGVEQVGAAGYAVANALTETNLALGHSVVADCVNPVRESRNGWCAAASRASACLSDIHLVCTDEVEHRRRVESRAAAIAGHALPSWADVMSRAFEPWDGRHLRLDTAVTTLEQLVDRCQAYVLA